MSTEDDLLTQLLEKYVRRSEDILKDNMVGVYLHGSAVLGCYNPKKSDIDLIVVVDKPLSPASKRAYMDMVTELNDTGPAKGIEMSIVTSEVCKPFVYPTPFELHFSVGHINWFRNDPDDYIAKMNGTDKDLAAHFTVIQKRGRCLYGKPIAEVFADVPKKDYMDSILYDIAEAREEIADNTMYLTLNLARVLAYRNEGLVLSKKEGGEWGMKNLPEEYKGLISDALREYTEGTEIIYDKEIAKRYADHILTRIRT